MKSFRKVLFWTHLVSGVAAGIVIAVMSLTGTILALQPQILLWAERGQRVVAPPRPDEPQLSVEELLARVSAQLPDANLTGVTREHDPTMAAAVTFAPRNAGGNAPAARPGGPSPAQPTVYADPYTGKIIGRLDQSSGARRFFRIVTDWHRWLALTGEQRDTGRWVTGISNAAFLALAVTGLYIWLPRIWSRPALNSILWFRRGISGKARDFNWHNVIGVWSALVLIMLTFTAVCISFPKTYDLIYRVAGIERPPAAAGGGGRERGAATTRPSAIITSAATFAGLDRAWLQAETQLPSWRSIALRLPQGAGQPATFTLTDRNRLNPMARCTLTVDVAEGAVLRWEPYAGLPAGQRLRTWVRFGHTGEVWGLAGQIIAGVASAGGCVLAWTGIALAWRRFSAWRTRRSRRDAATALRAAS